MGKRQVAQFSFARLTTVCNPIVMLGNLAETGKKLIKVSQLCTRVYTLQTCYFCIILSAKVPTGGELQLQGKTILQREYFSHIQHEVLRNVGCLSTNQLHPTQKSGLLCDNEARSVLLTNAIKIHICEYWQKYLQTPFSQTQNRSGVKTTRTTRCPPRCPNFKRKTHTILHNQDLYVPT